MVGQNLAVLRWGGRGDGGGPKAAIHSGLESALGSHPCVALSSYQALHCKRQLLTAKEKSSILVENSAKSRGLGQSPHS